jgi:hypothetical protein
MVEFSKYSPSWKIILETVTGDVIMSEVVSRMQVVLSKAEEHVCCGELVGNREYITLQTRCRKTNIVTTAFNSMYGPMLPLC